MGGYEPHQPPFGTPLRRAKVCDMIVISVSHQQNRDSLICRGICYMNCGKFWEFFYTCLLSIELYFINFMAEER